VGDFLVQMCEEYEETKLFVNGGKLVVGKDSFFKGKDFFPVHAVVAVSTCVKVRLDLVLDVSKSVLTRLTKQDLIKVEIKPRQIMLQVLTSNNSAQIRNSPFSLQG
jgi:hypothetical protein